MTTLRRADADIFGWGFLPGLFPLVLLFVGLALWGGQFRSLPKRSIYLNGYDTSCNKEWREPGWKRGDAHYEHLLLVSSCRLDLTDLEPTDYYEWWGDYAVFVLRAKSNPEAHPGSGTEGPATAQPPRLGRPRGNSGQRSRRPISSQSTALCRLRPQLQTLSRRFPVF